MELLKGRHLFSGAFRRYFLFALLGLFLPISILFMLLIRTTTQQFTDYMKRTEQQQLQLLEQSLAAEFYNDSQIVRSLLIYQNVRPFYLQNFPSRASDLIHNLNNHFTNNNIVDEIYVHFFCDEYFYSTQTSFSTRRFMSQFNLSYSEGGTGQKFLQRMEEMKSEQDIFYLRDVTPPRPSSSSQTPEKVILYVYPYVVDDSVVGSVIFQINETRLNSWIGNSTGRYTYLFDQDGDLLNATDYSCVTENGLPLSWIEQQIQRTIKGETLDLSKNGYYILSGTIPDTGLYYIRFVENATLFSALRKIQFFYLLLLFLLVMFGFAAFFFLSKPLRKLQSALSGKKNADFSEVDTFLDSYNDLKNTNLHFQDEANASARRDFLRQLLENPPSDPDSILFQAEKFNIFLTAPYHFVAIGQDEFQNEENLCAALTPSVHFSYLISVPDTAGFTRWLVGSDCFLERRQLQSPGLEGRLSVSGTRAGVAHIHDCYLEARSYWDIASAPSSYYRQMQLSINSFYKEQAQLACQQMEKESAATALDTARTMYQKMKMDNVPLDIQCQILLKIIFTTDQLVRTRCGEDQSAPLDISSLLFVEDPTLLFRVLEQQVQTLIEWESRVQMPAPPALTLEAVLAFIQEHYESESFSLQMLADHFHLSLSYLSLFFKERYGDTLLNYYTQLRMDKARHLLDTTEMSLREVVADVGYANTSSFIRRFKQLYGITPGEYKKNGAPPASDFEKST